MNIGTSARTATFAILLITIFVWWSETHANRFKHVKAKTWAKESSSENYPEMTDPSMAAPWLKGRPSFGVAFSGGGTRSASASLGQLRALSILGWLDQANYVSANSGGSWAVVPYTYLPEEFDEKIFLGPFVSPVDIDADVLDPIEDNRATLASAVHHAKFLDPDKPGRTMSLLKGDEGYAHFVGKVFLDPFNLNNKKKFFSFHRGAVDKIIISNPMLKSEDFYLARKNRPLPIVVGTLLGPSFGDSSRVRARFLFEMTGLYVGVGHQETIETGQSNNSEDLLIGGGYIEPFGYDSYAPGTSGTDNERVEVRLKGKSGWRRTTRYMFTLSDMIGISSAAPHVTLADKQVKNMIFPEFRYWAINREQVLNEPGLQNEARELKHGDGGDIDNLAVLPLLARKVENILVFINTSTAFDSRANCASIQDTEISDSLTRLFRPSEKHKDVVVFEDGDTQIARICEDFKNRKKRGGSLVSCGIHQIRNNPRFGINSDMYTPTICWLYLDRPKNWVDKIPEPPTDNQTIVGDLKCSTGKFSNFPFFDTFGEKGKLIIDLDRERVHAMSNLTAWSLFDGASEITQQLSTGNLELTRERVPANYDDGHMQERNCPEMAND